MKAQVVAIIGSALLVTVGMRVALSSPNSDPSTTRVESPSAPMMIQPLTTAAHPLATRIEQFLARQERFGSVEPTHLTRTDYLKVIAGQIKVMRGYQNASGRIIDPVLKWEVCYATPCYAYAVAILAASGYDADPALVESGMKAMDVATADMAAGNAPPPVNNTGDFFTYPLMMAMPLYAKVAAPERLAAWRENMRRMDPLKVYHQRGPRKVNWAVINLAGDYLRAAAGLTTMDYVEAGMAHQLESFNDLGMYIDDGYPPPAAYDHFPRYFLAAILRQGYHGNAFERCRDMVWRGAWTSLFMMSPTGQAPTGGRSSNHIWNEAQSCATYEIFAAQYAKAGRLAEAGAFKRAAHLSLQCVIDWLRPDGTGYIVKNRFPLEARHGYETYSAHTVYNLLACSQLAGAWQFADDGVVERAAPCDVGGYVVLIPGPFHKIFASAAGTYVEYNTCADHKYNPTGLLRIHLKDGHPQLGPSDGCAPVYSGAGVNVAVGPLWQETSGEWCSLAEQSVHSPQIEILDEQPDRAVFRVTFSELQTKMRNQPALKVTETITVEPAGVTVRDEISDDAVHAMRIAYPMLVFDGLEKTHVQLNGGRLEMAMGGRGVKFEVMQPAGVSLVRSGKELKHRNGMVETVYADVPDRVAVYKISAGARPATGPAAGGETVRFLPEPYASEFAPDTIRLVLHKVADHYLTQPASPAAAGLWRAGLLAVAGIGGASRYQTAADSISAAEPWTEVVPLTDEARRQAVLMCSLIPKVAQLTRDHYWTDPAAKKFALFERRLLCESADPVTAGLMVYATAWGGSRTVQLMGSDSYRKHAIRGWLNLDRQIGSDGAWKQAAGDPHLAAGAFLLAGAQILCMSEEMLRPPAFAILPNYQKDLAYQQQQLAAAPEPTPEITRQTMKRVCQWQHTSLWQVRGAADGNDPDTSWYRGVLYAGMVPAYQATHDEYYLDLARSLAQRNRFLLDPGAANRDFNAFTLAQCYLDLYALERKPEYLAAMRTVTDRIFANPRLARPMAANYVDFLFTAPGAWSRMGVLNKDARCLDYVKAMWTLSEDKLLDKNDGLFVRDTTWTRDDDGFAILEHNGRKVYWGRGNGWAIAGLCRMLDYLPADDPQRPQFERRLRDLSAALIKVQGTDGMWRASLLNQEMYPLGETSSTGLITYSLAWGVNRGILERTPYEAAARRGWRALLACVEANGKLGYVQSGADSPCVPFFRHTNVEYATGAFLLAGSEMLKLLAGVGTAGEAHQAP